MIIFVFGENTYSSQQKVIHMRDQFRAKFDKSGMNVVEFAEKYELGDVMQAIQSPPFISEKRMVIVKGLLERLKKAEEKIWLESLSRTPESTIVILFDELASKKIQKSKLYKGLQDESEVHNYVHDSLTPKQLNSWTQRWCQEKGLQIDNRLLQQVVGMVGSDLWQLSGELEKLLARAQSESVTPKMVSELVRTNYQDQIFAFIDAVSNGQTKRAFELLEAQRKAGSDDFQLLAMLGRQIKLLLGVRSLLDKNEGVSKGEVAKELGVHPFVAQKTLAQAKKFNSKQLAGLHEMIFELDQQIKTGRISLDLAVERIVTAMVLKT